MRLCEAKVHGNGQPIFIADDFNDAHLKKDFVLPCAWNKGGWFLNQALLLDWTGSANTCKVNWTSEGTRRDFLVARPLALTSALNCWVHHDRWFKPHFSVKATINVKRWNAQVTQVVTCTPLWPAHFVKATDRSGHSTSQDVTKIWEVYDSGLQYMPIEVIRVGIFGPLPLSTHYATHTVWQVSRCL